MSKPRKSTRRNHLDLARRVVEAAGAMGLLPGDHLPEQVFAQLCGVSRTPIRSAFKLLNEQDVLTRREEEGYFLAEGLDDQGMSLAQQLDTLEDDLAARILADRKARRLGETHPVSFLVRRYGASRHTVLNALKILQQDGVIDRLVGQAWAFRPILDTANAVDESLQFRLVMEPQAILAPSFTLDRKEAGAIRQQFQAALDNGERRIGSALFLRLDVAFHSLVAKCSGNRFARDTLLSHHRLRFITHKDFAITDYRTRSAIKEHLDILDSLENEQFDVAADRMALHLRLSRNRRPDAANRGSPALMRIPGRS